MEENPSILENSSPHHHHRLKLKAKKRSTGRTLHTMSDEEEAQKHHIPSPNGIGIGALDYKDQTRPFHQHASNRVLVVVHGSLSKQEPRTRDYSESTTTENAGSLVIPWRIVPEDPPPASYVPPRRLWRRHNRDAPSLWMSSLLLPARKRSWQWLLRFAVLLCLLISMIAIVYVIFVRGSNNAPPSILEGGSFTQLRPANVGSSTQDFLFGSSVAIQNDTLVVGATARHGKSGSAFVFRDVKHRWIQEQELHFASSNSTSTEQFGRLVAVDSVHQRLVVGGDCSFHVYSSTVGHGWVLEHRELKLPMITGEDNACHRPIQQLIVQGNMVLATTTTATYVYMKRIDGWALQQEVIGGRSVALNENGETLVIATEYDGVQVFVKTRRDVWVATAGFELNNITASKVAISWGAILVAEELDTTTLRCSRRIGIAQWAEMPCLEWKDTNSKIQALDIRDDTLVMVTSNRLLVYSRNERDGIQWQKEQDVDISSIDFSAAHGVLGISNQTVVVGSPKELGGAVYTFYIHNHL